MAHEQRLHSGLVGGEFGAWREALWREFEHFLLHHWIAPVGTLRLWHAKSRALVHKRKFVVATLGSSVTAAHDNCNYDYNYAYLQLQLQLQ